MLNQKSIYLQKQEIICSKIKQNQAFQVILCLIYIFIPKSESTRKGAINISNQTKILNRAMNEMR